MLDQCNPYVQVLRMAKERFDQSIQMPNLKLRLISHRSTDSNTYNLPTASEVAALFVGDFDTSFGPRDIIVETKTRELQRISELHPAYLPLQYPLLFPYGEDGYHIDLELKKISTTSENPRTKVSMREFFAYKIMERKDEPSYLMHTGKLFQQFVVDGLTMIEAERISYLQFNQKTLRAEKYSNVEASADKGNNDSSMCGRRIVLPSSFIGGARYMQQKYMDAMALCQHYGYPDMFITFTCNPKWPEITRYLNARGLNSEDRADIVTRVFKMKLDNLIWDIKNNNLQEQVQLITLLLSINFIIYFCNESIYKSNFLQLFTRLNFKKEVYHMHIYCCSYRKKPKFQLHLTLTSIYGLKFQINPHIPFFTKL